MDIAQMDGGHRWRVIGWGAAVALLATPFVAMQFTREVNWTPSDFVFMGAMLATVGGLLELAVRAQRNWSYRGGVALALLGGFLLTWVNLAVGIVGSEHNPNNQLFFIALLVGIAGAIGGRFRADGMKRATITTAIAIVLAFLLAETAPRDEPAVHQLVEAVGTSIFVLLFAGSALLFRRAERQARA